MQPVLHSLLCIFCTLCDYNGYSKLQYEAAVHAILQSCWGVVNYILPALSPPLD